MLSEKQRREAIEFLVSVRPKRFAPYLEVTEPGGDRAEAAAESFAMFVRELEGWSDAKLEGVYLQAKADLERRQAEIRESRLPFNSPAAKAVDLNYWVAMEFWPFDEAIALVCGRSPSHARWDQVKACVKLSPFAEAFEKVRVLAQRSEHMNYGRSTVWRNSACVWLLQNLSAIPEAVRPSAMELADAIVKRVVPISATGPIPSEPAAELQPVPEEAPDRTGAVEQDGNADREHSHARQDRRLERFEQLGGAMRKAGDSWHSNGGRPGALADLAREERERSRPMADRSDVRRDLIKAIERRLSSEGDTGVKAGRI